jgi:hypothetical protein
MPLGSQAGLSPTREPDSLSGRTPELFIKTFDVIDMKILFLVIEILCPTGEPEKISLQVTFTTILSY